MTYLAYHEEGQYRPVHTGEAYLLEAKEGTSPMGESVNPERVGWSRGSGKHPNGQVYSTPGGLKAWPYTALLLASLAFDFF